MLIVLESFQTKPYERSFFQVIPIIFPREKPTRKTENDYELTLTIVATRRKQ